MEDMEDPIAEGKKRGISIIMDLVVNHCSSHHEWFQKALADPDGPYAGLLFISSKVTRNPTTGKVTLGAVSGNRFLAPTNTIFIPFHKDQPDLNWQNPVVREGNLQDDQLVVWIRESQASD